MISKRGKRPPTRPKSSTNNSLILTGEIDDKSRESHRYESDQFAYHSSSALSEPKHQRRRRDFSLAAFNKSQFVIPEPEPVREPEIRTQPQSRCRREEAASDVVGVGVAVDEFVALQTRTLPNAIKSPSRRRPSGARLAFCRTSNGNYKTTRLRLDCLLLAIFVVFCSKLLLLLAAETGGANFVLEANKLNSGQLSRLKRATSNSKIVGAEQGNSKGDNETILVQTKHGLFKGVLLASNRDDHEQQPSNREADIVNDANVVGFLGIRYASAPIKRLRFMPPTAYQYTPNQVHSMQNLGPICRQRWPVELGYLAAQQQQAQGGSEESTGEQSSWQNSQLLLMKRMMPRQSFVHLRPLFKRLASMEQSEDCLNLNVYAPLGAIPNVAGNQRERPLVAPEAPPTTLRPVLVIIHGDSFDFGAGSAVDAPKFVQLNRMLAVTFNYRLNILGFPPKLAGASRGNLGLMDQVAALHWIKDNIGSFGGAANNITLMGTKRGAIFVNLLMLSPLARGLFQRAIMEDGSALTPLIANQIGSPLASAMLVGGQLQSSNSLAAHYLRLLAKLCDCPVYLRPAAAAAAAASSSSSSSLASNITASSAASGTGGGASSTANGAVAVSVVQQQLAGFADETKANALTFECLRQKPVEQIMQRVPLDLLQFNQVSGEITIAQRFLNKGFSASPSILQQQPSSTTLLDSIGALDSVQLGRLVERVTREQLERESADIRRPAAESRGSESPTISNTPTSSQLDLAMAVEELFGAIYGQPSAIVRPLFAPVLDGTIVPDEDIASNMMKAGSLFGQRDLLIGVSQKSLSETTAWQSSNQLDSDKNEQQQQQSMSTRTSSESPLKLGPDHLMAERITEQMERFGLSSEQAIELVNSFVRSLYRHHNQEISNSIVNNYLVQSSGGSRRVTAKKQFKQQSANSQYHRSDPADEQLSDEIQAKISQQQLLALDSLLEAFQDALTNVPVLKTALIHATRQLDSLVDAFVGQQFEKWKQTHWPAAVNDSSSSGSGNSNSNSLKLPDQNQLLDSFISFAQSLFNDPGWPLKLHSPSNASVQQPKGTYLFQFDSQILISEIQNSLNRLGTMRGSSSYSFGWKGLKEALSGLLVRLQSGQQFGDVSGRRLGLSCGLELDTSWPNENELAENSERHQHDLWTKLNDWLCLRLTKTLGNFVASGNVNEVSLTQSSNNNQEQRSSISQTFSALSERIARFEAKCNSVNQLRVPVPADHHSVLAATSGIDEGRSSTSSIISQEHQREPTTANIGAPDFECNRELNSIAFDYLVGDGGNYFSLDQQYRWKVFNLFTQQIATLPSSSKQHLWLVNEVTDSGQSAYHDQKSSLSARSSFWANFIPALNCSRTQPIIPSSFMLSNRPLASISNSSSLLSLNLQFHCQMGSRSALDAIESLSSNINQQLQARIGDWRLSRVNAAQNHHTLRMANMSQSSSIEENIEQQEPIDEHNSNANKGSTVGAARGGQTTGDGAGQPKDGQQQDARAGPHSGDMRSKYIGILVVVCGLVISLSLASGACAVMRQRGQQQQSKQKRKAKRKSFNSPSLPIQVPNNNSNQANLENNPSSHDFSLIGEDGDDSDNEEQEQVPADQTFKSSTQAQTLDDPNALCEEQQQTSFSVAAFNELALENQGQFQTADQHSIRREGSAANSSGQQQHSLSSSNSFVNSNRVSTVQQHQTADDNHIGNGNGSFVLWNQPEDLVGGQDLLLDGTGGQQQQVTLCRSHSSLDGTVNGARSMMNNQSLVGGGVGQSATLARLSHVQVPSPNDQQLAGFATVAIHRHCDDTHQQPIMLPLLTNPVVEFHRDQQQQPLGGANGLGSEMDHHLRHQHGLLTQVSNGSHYGGSSSETTQATQSSGGSPSVRTIARVYGSTSGRRTLGTTMLANNSTVASNKKRVKISDPVSATIGHYAKRAAEQKKYININKSLSDKDQQTVATRMANSESQLSLESSAPNYCPVHWNQHHQRQPMEASLDGSQTNYLVKDAFLSTNLWDGTQTIDLLDQRLASVSINCDQFSSDNTTTTPLCSYFGGQAPQQLQSQLYHYAPSSSQIDPSSAAFVTSLTGMLVKEPNQNQHHGSYGLGNR